MKIYMIVLGFLVSILAWAGTSLPAQAGFVPSDAACIQSAQAGGTSTTATQCRNAGWVIRDYIAVGPNNNVRWWDRNVMRKCNNEYGGYNWPCWWNFDVGPGQGSDFWYGRDHDGPHYVNDVTI